MCLIAGSLESLQHVLGKIMSYMMLLLDGLTIHSMTPPKDCQLMKGMVFQLKCKGLHLAKNKNKNP